MLRSRGPTVQRFWGGPRGIHYHQFLHAGENTLNIRLAALLARCLAVDPDARPQSAAEVRDALDEVLAAKPTADFDAAWGQGFLKPDRWVEINYRGMTAR